MSFKKTCYYNTNEIQGRTPSKLETFWLAQEKHSHVHLLWRCTVTRIRNMYSIYKNHNSATSLPNTKFIFPKQIFIILCRLSLYQWDRGLECWRWSASCPNYYSMCCTYTNSWNCQMLAAEQLLPGQSQHGLLFPASIMVKIAPTGSLSSRYSTLTVDNEVQRTLIKKKIKFSSYIRKFRVEQLQSHI